MGFFWVFYILVVRYLKLRWLCFFKFLIFYFCFKVRDYLELRLKEVFGDKIYFNGKFEISVCLLNICNVLFFGLGLEGWKILVIVKFL